jgi:signal transduction histidine kinase
MKTFLFYTAIGLIFFCAICCSDSPDNNMPAATSADTYLKRGADPEKTVSEREKNTSFALAAIVKQKNTKQVRCQLLKVIKNYIQINEWSKLNKALPLAIRMAKAQEDMADLSSSYAYYGYYHMQKSSNDSAFYYFHKAKRIFEAEKKREHICVSYLYLAELYYYTSDYLSSEKCALIAVEYAKLTNNRGYAFQALTWIGNNANEMGDYDKAIDYHVKALSSVDARNNGYSKECTLYNIAYNYDKEGKYYQAIRIYRKALDGIKKPSFAPLLYARVLDNMAHAEFALHNYKAVPDTYNRAARIRKEYKIDAGKNYNRLYLSEYFFAIGDSMKAKRLALEALEISESFKASHDKLIVLKHLISIDRKSAQKYSKRFIALSDSLQLAERKTRNKFARIAYETDEITHEKDNAVKQKWIAYSASGMSIVIGGLLLLVRVQRSKQRELLFEQEQQKSNESIYRLINDQQIRIDEARQAEKTRIAQELHDGVMNRLASTRLNLFVLNKQKDDQTIKKCISLIDGIQDIEKEIRQVAHDLNHEIFSGNNSFHTLLEALFESQKTGSAAAMYSESDQSINWAQIDSAVKMNIYRILQEALQNANKHAKAKNIFVTVSRDESEDIIHINVYDDGIGFNPAKNKGGIGMKNMRERVAAINGKFEIQSPMGKGTNIRIAVPVRRIV